MPKILRDGIVVSYTTMDNAMAKLYENRKNNPDSIWTLEMD